MFPLLIRFTPSRIGVLIRGCFSLRIYGIPVCDSADYFYDHVQKMLDDLDLGNVSARDICCMIDGHKGGGYGISSESERGRDSRILIKRE